MPFRRRARYGCSEADSRRVLLSILDKSPGKGVCNVAAKICAVLKNRLPRTSRRVSMSSNRHRAKGFRGWRAPLVVVFVIPAVLCAVAVKSARASFYKVQPILCDGADDDSGAPLLCALPEETTKELSSMNARHTRSPRFSVPWLPAPESRRREASDRSHRLNRHCASGDRSRPVPESSDDPDGPHEARLIRVR
jgi:hypothetical protein